ncbi:MAG: DUF2339 domain-containing protein, partial [Planctomycetota bacterium]
MERSSETATPESRSSVDLERFLGVQVAAWIGAIIVITAIGIFAKFAIDQGWLERTPAAVKLAAAYALAGAFILAGTLLRERVGRLPSAAMLSAGIGGLFVSTCAGVTILDVFGPVAALVVGVAAAILGGALALRSRELVVAAIGLLGAYVVPMFSGIYRLGDATPWTGALYLTGVYAVALLLARLGPPNFAWLRLAGALQAASGFLLLLESGRGSPAMSLVFTATWWAMAVGECSFAALKGAVPRFNTAVTVAATLIAATLTLRGIATTNPWTDLHSWLPLAMAIVAAAAAASLHGFAPAGSVDERDRTEDPEAHAVETACARQTTVLAVLAGALALAQIGVLLRGGGLAITWTVVSAAAILIGRRLSQQSTTRLGVASAMLGVAATAWHAISPKPGSTVLFEYPSDPALREGSAWAFRIADTHATPFIVALGLLLAARFRSIGADRDRLPPLASGVLAACAALLWIALALAIGFSYATVTMLLAIPTAAMLVGRTLSLVRLIALLGSIIAGLAWLAFTLIHSAAESATRPSGGEIAAM